jgi:hypothetical protein
MDCSRMPKNYPNTWTKRSKQKHEVKQHQEGLCIFSKGQRTVRNYKQTSIGEGLHWTRWHPTVLAATLRYKKTPAVSNKSTRKSGMKILYTQCSPAGCQYTFRRNKSPSSSVLKVKTRNQSEAGSNRAETSVDCQRTIRSNILEQW